MSQVRSVRDEANTERNKQRLYYHYDSLGSVSVVTSEIGKPLQEYYYTPYGECFNVASDSINGLRFVGRYGGYTDDDTGLTYFWHRWYDSDDGRWVSRDPIFQKYKNLKKIISYSICDKSREFLIGYSYSQNNPENVIDDTGLSPVSLLKRLPRPMLEVICNIFKDFSKSCGMEYEKQKECAKVNDAGVQAVVKGKCETYKKSLKLIEELRPICRTVKVDF